MDEMLNKACERFYSEFTQMYSEAAPKDKWPKECVETMKDLLKCIYYCKVINAMEGGEYPSENGNSFAGGYSGGYSEYSGYNPGNSMAQNRNVRGQFSRNSMASGGRRSYNSSYDDGRRNAIAEEARMALQNALAELDMR